MTKEDLKESILKEVNKTGFPLELRVSKLLMDSEYYVANNLYYIDQDEGKGREVDIRALKNFVFEEGGKSYCVRHCLLIECKRSAERPWVVFTSSKTSYDKEIFELDCRGGKGGDEWVTDEVVKELEKIHPFEAYKRRGRS